MIRYSLTLMSNPFDTTSEPKAYARAQCTEVVSFDSFVQHIADHNGVFTKGTVQGVITDMCKCLKEMLLDGKKVYMGDLGDFFISLSSEGAATMAAFSATNITDVNILYTPGDNFENLRSQATFEAVSTRAAQAATLKAEKAGETTVDLAAAKGTTSDDSTDEDTSTGTDSSTGSSSGSGTSSSSSSSSGTSTGNEDQGEVED